MHKTLSHTERGQSASLYLPNRASGAGVLFLHGYNSSKVGYLEYARALAKQRSGVAALAIDLAGHGSSGGDFNTLTPREYLDDVVGAYAYLENSGEVDPARIGVVGASYGGYLAALLAAEKKPKSLLLRAPAIYPDTMIDVARESVDKEEVEEFRTSLASSTPTNLAIDTIRDFDGIVTIVESENDESIQTSVIDTYVNVSKNGLHKIIPGAKHSLVGVEREVFKEMLLDWAADL